MCDVYILILGEQLKILTAKLRVTHPRESTKEKHEKSMFLSTNLLMSLSCLLYLNVVDIIIITVLQRMHMHNNIIITKSYSGLSGFNIYV